MSKRPVLFSLLVHDASPSMAQHHARIGTQDRHTLLQHSWIAEIIRRCPFEVASAGLLSNKIPVARPADVGRLANVTNARVARSVVQAYVGGAICGRVIRDDELEIVQGLARRVSSA